MGFSVIRAHRVEVTLDSHDRGSTRRIERLTPTDLEPSARIRRAFKVLAAGKLPPGHVPRSDWGR